MQFILIAVTQEQFHLLCLALVALLIKPLPVYTFFIDFEPIAVLDRFVGKDRLKITGLLFRPPVETETFHPYAFAGLHAFGGIDDKPFEEIERFDQIRFPAGIGPVDDRTLQQREVRSFKLKNNLIGPGLFFFQRGSSQRQGRRLLERKEIFDCELNNHIISQLYVSFMQI